MKQVINLLFVLCISMVMQAHAETIPLTTLSVEIDKGLISGSGRTVTFNRVPVTDSATNITRYYDFTAGLKVDSNNQLYFDNIGDVVDVTDLIASSPVIKAGIYQDAQGYYYQVFQPSLSNGYFEYSMQYINTSNSGDSLVMRWNTSTLVASSIIPEETERFAKFNNRGFFGHYTKDMPGDSFWGSASGNGEVLVELDGDTGFTVAKINTFGNLDNMSRFTYRYATIDELNNAL
jgi:hypothetical protein